MLDAKLLKPLLPCKQQPLIIGTFEKRARGPIFPNYGPLALLWPQLFERWINNAISFRNTYPLDSDLSAGQ